MGAQTSPPPPSELLTQQTSHATSSASSATGVSGETASPKYKEQASAEETITCLAVLEALEQARQDSDNALQQFKWILARCRQSIDQYNHLLQSQSQIHSAAIDQLTDVIKKRLNDSSKPLPFIDGHPQCPPNAKADANCVGVPNASHLALNYFRRAVSNPKFKRVNLSPVAPQVTGAVIPPPPKAFIPPKAAAAMCRTDPRTLSSFMSTRGKSDPLLRNMLAAKQDPELLRNEWMRTVLTAGNWKKTLEAATYAKCSSPEFFTAEARSRRQQSTSTGGDLGDSAMEAEHSTTAGEQLAVDDGDNLSAALCFGDLLTQTVEDLEIAPQTGEGVSQDLDLRTATVADRLATSVFSHLEEVSSNDEDHRTMQTENQDFNKAKCQSMVKLLPLRGRTEPPIKGLMTSELLKRTNLMGRDDYLFFEWLSPSDQSSADAPYGAFRAEIIFNSACIDLPHELLMADSTSNAPSAYEDRSPPASTVPETDIDTPVIGGGESATFTKGARLDPASAQMIFETETCALEEYTREAGCRAFRHVMDWAEDRIQQLRLPSPMSVASVMSETRSPSGTTQEVPDAEQWDGDFSVLSCHPLPPDYGRSELFDKRGSMRYIQLAATNPQVPASMAELKTKARNFQSWYTVQYGNGMWKAEVIVDQLNSKRNSFQRSLKQMSYQSAQLQVMRWLFKKCRELKIGTFRYKGRKDEFLITVPPLRLMPPEPSTGFTLLECPDTKRKRDHENEKAENLKRRRQ